MHGDRHSARARRASEACLKRLLQRASLVCSLLCVLTACGPTMYLAAVGDAESQLQQAEKDNAQAYAAYEYYAAESYIEKAREEAAEGHYEDAVEYASRAETLAKRARQRAGYQGASGGSR